MEVMDEKKSDLRKGVETGRGKPTIPPPQSLHRLFSSSLQPPWMAKYGHGVNCVLWEADTA